MSVQVVLQCNHCNEIRLIMIYSFAMLIVTIFENLAYEIILLKAINDSFHISLSTSLTAFL